MISLTSTAELLDRIQHARSITFSAYGLWNEKVESALEYAARRGASVAVRLNGRFRHPTHEMPDLNRRYVRRLRNLGADAKLVTFPKRGHNVFHLKAAVCDGVAFLDDCNWRNAGDTIVRDNSPADVRAIRAAAAYEPAPAAQNVQLDKTAALWAETDLLETPHAKRVDIESESFGFGGVYGAIQRLAKRHVHVRLLFSGQDHNAKHLKAVQDLEKAGAEVRVTCDTEKFAVVNGRHAWIGSANATFSYPNETPQPDWGVLTGRAQVTDELERRFEARWQSAKPL